MIDAASGISNSFVLKKLPENYLKEKHISRMSEVPVNWKKLPNIVNNLAINFQDERAFEVSPFQLKEWVKEARNEESNSS